MKSTDVQKLGFSSFQKLGPDMTNNIPAEPGVYVFRAADKRMIGRLKGKSDILYIGCSLKSIRRRLGFYFKPGPTQWTNIRINSLLNRYPVEIAYKISSAPKYEESKILLKYFEEHDELPPFNFSGGLKQRYSNDKKFPLKKKMTNEEKILSIIRQEDKGYCDDCLSLKSKVKPRQQVNQILRRRNDIVRVRAKCAGCGRIKIVNKLKMQNVGITNF